MRLASRQAMRTHFAAPVVGYMNRELHVARADSPIEELARAMHGRGISGIPIVDDRRQLIGVVTRTDLIKLGLLQAGNRPSNSVMPLPHRKASEVMTHRPLEINSTTSLRAAAELMVARDVHRLFVTEHGMLAGVLCAVDLTAAVRDARLDTPVSAIMTSPIITIDVHTPLSAATGLLDRAHVTGLIVTEEGQPIGMFTQVDALASRDLPRSTPVETTYDAAVMCLPGDMKVHRVAAHVADLRVRRVVVCEARDPVGIVSATDFARLVAIS